MTNGCLQQGVFVISIDYERAWGYVDRMLSPRDEARIRGETAIVLRLLELFERYRMPATWAIVGHLLEPRHESDDDTAWFDADGLVSRIAASPARHEIGSHSYAHILYGDPRTTEALAGEDIAHARRIHDEHDLPFCSFVFPRNSEGHHEVLKRYGIICFRGHRGVWYDILPTGLRALWRGVDYWLPTASTGTPRVHPTGLLDIPEGLLLVSRKGVQKLLPTRQTYRKVVWGLNRAVKRRKVFHLWFHPSNFSYDTEKQLALFDRILARAARLREAGKLSCLTMGALAESCANRNT
jgi:hypothetical protein